MSETCSWNGPSLISWASAGPRPLPTALARSTCWVSTLRTGVGESVSARATLTVPFLGIGVKGLDYEVTRYTVMPRTD